MIISQVSYRTNGPLVNYYPIAIISKCMYSHTWHILINDEPKFSHVVAQLLIADAVT